MRAIIAAVAVAVLLPSAAQAQFFGNYTSNQYQPNRINPQQYSGNKFSNGDNSPGLYTNDGQFRGNLNSNRYDPNSVANPYGKYGSKFSSDSINNPYGAGSPYNSDSPNNPYGNGLRVCGVNGCE